MVRLGVFSAVGCAAACRARMHACLHPQTGIAFEMASNMTNGVVLPPQRTTRLNHSAAPEDGSREQGMAHPQPTGGALVVDDVAAPTGRACWFMKLRVDFSFEEVYDYDQELGGPSCVYSRLQTSNPIEEDGDSYDHFFGAVDRGEGFRPPWGNRQTATSDEDFVRAATAEGVFSKFDAAVVKKMVECGCKGVTAAEVDGRGVEVLGPAEVTAADVAAVSQSPEIGTPSTSREWVLWRLNTLFVEGVALGLGSIVALGWVESYEEDLGVPTFTNMTSGEVRGTMGPPTEIPSHVVKMPLMQRAEQLYAWYVRVRNCVVLGDRAELMGLCRALTKLARCAIVSVAARLREREERWDRVCDSSPPRGAADGYDEEWLAHADVAVSCRRAAEECAERRDFVAAVEAVLTGGRADLVDLRVKAGDRAHLYRQYLEESGVCAEKRLWYDVAIAKHKALLAEQVAIVRELEPTDDVIRNMDHFDRSNPDDMRLGRKGLHLTRELEAKKSAVNIAHRELLAARTVYTAALRVKTILKAAVDELSEPTEAAAVRQSLDAVLAATLEVVDEVSRMMTVAVCGKEWGAPEMALESVELMMEGEVPRSEAAVRLTRALCEAGTFAFAQGSSGLKVVVRMADALSRQLPPIGAVMLFHKTCVTWVEVCLGWLRAGLRFNVQDVRLSDMCVARTTQMVRAARSRRCQRCGAIGARMMCGGCRDHGVKVAYCNRECAAADRALHVAVCRGTGRRAVAEARQTHVMRVEPLEMRTHVEQMWCSLQMQYVSLARGDVDALDFTMGMYVELYQMVIRVIGMCLAASRDREGRVSVARQHVRAEMQSAQERGERGGAHGARMKSLMAVVKMMGGGPHATGAWPECVNDRPPDQVARMIMSPMANGEAASADYKRRRRTCACFLGCADTLRRLYEGGTNWSVRNARRDHRAIANIVNAAGGRDGVYGVLASTEEVVQMAEAAEAADWLDVDGGLVGRRRSRMVDVDGGEAVESRSRVRAAVDGVATFMALRAFVQGLPHRRTTPAVPVNDLDAMHAVLGDVDDAVSTPLGMVSRML